MMNSIQDMHHHALAIFQASGLSADHPAIQELIEAVANLILMYEKGEHPCASLDELKSRVLCELGLRELPQDG